MHQLLIIIGNVGKDPEMRYTPSGTAVTKMNVATNREYNDSSGQKVKETTWFVVTCWGKLAEVVSQYVQKGKKVYVEGHLDPDPSTGGPKVWTRQDGTAGASFEVTAKTVRFLSSPQESGGSGGYGASSDQSSPADDEFPF